MAEEQLYTGEEIKAMGYNGDTVSSIGGKYKLSQFTGGASGTTSAPKVSTVWDDPAKLNEYLKTYQSDVLKSSGLGDAVGPDGKVSFSSIESALTPNNDAPEVLNRVQLFGQYRTAYGVDSLEAELNDLKGQADDLTAQLRVNKTAERGKPVAQNVIEGRMSEQERNTQEQLDYIGKRQSRVTDQLNTAYSVINMYMNFQSLDYQDAAAAYEKEFTQNMSVFTMLRGIRTDAISEATAKTDVAFKQANLDLQYQDAARSNLQIMANAITSGNLDPNSLSADQKVALNKLEVQSGLPVGFVSSLGLSTKDRIMFTSTNNGVTQVGIANADGTISVKSYGTSTATGTANAAQLKSLKADVAAKMTLEDVMKKYGNSVAPDTILSTYNEGSPWGKAKQSAEELNAKYNTTIDKSKKTEASTIGSDLADAKSAIAGGANADLVRQRFLENHPTSAAVWDSYGL